MNEGAEYTQTRGVTLTLSGNGNALCYQMQLQAFSKKKMRPLLGPPGPALFYA
jgi:hypothetical protein